MKYVPLTNRPCLVVLLVLVLWAASPALAQLVLVNTQRGKVGETITFTVSLDQATKVVDALGLTLVYDPAVLHYTGTFTKGPLVQGFDFFDVHELQPGQIRVGGFTTKEAIAQGAQGDLVSLVFTVVSAGNTTIQVTQLVDGLAGLTAVPGTFTGEMSSLQGAPPTTLSATQTEPTEAGVIPPTSQQP